MDAERVVPADSRGGGHVDSARIVPFLQSLAAYPRHRRLYPAGHPRIAALLEELEDHLTKAFDDDEEAIDLVVRGELMDVNDVPLKSTSSGVQQLARGLSLRRVHALRMTRGMTREEIHVLADLLDTDHREILRRGGPEVFLATREHPHFELTPFDENPIEKSGTGDRIVLDRPLSRLPEELLPAFRAVLASADTMRRIEELREYVEEFQGRRATVDETVEVLEQVIRALLLQMDTAGFDEERLREVIHHFLDLLETRLQTEATELAKSAPASQDKVAQLVAFALELPKGERAPDLLKKLSYLKELLRPHEPVEEALGKPAEGRGGSAIETPEASAVFDVVNFDKEDLEALYALEFAEQRFRSELETFPVEEMYLRIICQLMLDAKDEEHYQSHREQLLRALGGEQRTDDAVAGILLYMSGRMPAPRYESRAALLRDALAEAKGGASLGNFFFGMRDSPEAIDGAIRALTESASPFATLTGLLLDDRLDNLHPRVEEGFLRAARKAPGEFRAWLRSDRESLFHPRVFRVILRLDTSYLTTVAQEVGAKGSDADRRRLIQALADEGGVKSLEVLLEMLGVDVERKGSIEERIGEVLRQSSDGDSEIVEALASFKHPKAVEVLRAVVEHNNSGSYDRAQAATAIRALSRIGNREAREYLRRVAEERRWWILYAYRGDMRTLAAQLLWKGGEI